MSAAQLWTWNGDQLFGQNRVGKVHFLTLAEGLWSHYTTPGRLCIRFLKRQEYFSSFPVFYCLEIFEKGEKKAPSP